jgi:hypothetical protein
MQAYAQRIFKTAWFAKAARSADIIDADLCKAAGQPADGLGDDLGGNVWKKRLDKNTKRGIVVNKVGEFWIFVFLFAKNDIENIDDKQLKKLKKLAVDYQKLTRAALDRALESKDLVEICNG